MDLKSGYPYWAIKNGLPRNYPRLESSASTEVLIVGGGITSALICDELWRAGIEVIVVEQRDIGWGSTAASTALLQYEIDTHLTELAGMYGSANAELAYKSCYEAIAGLSRMARTIGDVDFARCTSVYAASSADDVDSLRQEYEARQAIGLDVSFVLEAELDAKYGIASPAAIASRVAARIDPYRLTNKLFGQALKAGVAVYDRSVVEQLRTHTRGVVASLSGGVEVKAKHVVLACGYETQRWLRQSVASNRSSYALMSDPFDEAILGNLKHTMVWESARPYVYIRTTNDNRVLIGGEDDAVDVPARRDRRLEKKQRELLRKARILLPHLEVIPAYTWAGTFAETKDGLPYFGLHRDTGSRVHFAMAYGGNGITYSWLGAKLIRAAIERSHHELTELFSFRRHGGAKTRL